ncbi:hypothetical protein [Haloplanus sp.]|uniref:hypothetical protein n=1 Tax=Haloplanus sp. TaxID=1961696 RepID=UPI00261E1BE8|nr:hypothetical protein [Haloplanus sp.]
MLRRLRETAPAALVPLAWTVVAAAHADAVTARAIFVAHVVMSLFLTTFVVTGWREMADGVLRTWRTIITAGLGVTLLGVTGFVVDTTPLLAVSLYAWMVLPAFGLLYTGRAVGDPAPAYLAGGAVALLGPVVYATTPSLTLPALTLVGVGQTAGIVDAVVRY